VSRLRYLAWRTGWAVVAVYVVATATFVLVAGTEDPNQALVQWGATVGDAPQEAVSAYAQARNLNVPLIDRYVNFLVDFTTLDWGRSFESGRLVTDVVLEGTFVTGLYLVPAVVLSVVAATYVAIVGATRDSRLFDGLSRVVSYGGVGIPSFWLAAVISSLLAAEFDLVAAFSLSDGLFDPGNLAKLVFPVLVVTVALFGTLLRYVRAEVRDQLGEQYVKTARAKGTGRWGTARHVLRNAALPLVSLVFAELLGVLFLTGFVVEVVFGVEGLLDIAYVAIQRRDVPVVMGAALVPIVVGVVGNLLQDVVYTALDPRIEFR
jgi:peptide/nickel transport system permease protein